MISRKAMDVILCMLICVGARVCGCLFIGADVLNFVYSRKIAHRANVIFVLIPLPCLAGART